MASSRFMMIYPVFSLWICGANIVIFRQKEEVSLTSFNVLLAENYDCINNKGDRCQNVAPSGGTRIRLDTVWLLRRNPGLDPAEGGLAALLRVAVPLAVTTTIRSTLNPLINIPPASLARGIYIYNIYLRRVSMFKFQCSATKYDKKFGGLVKLAYICPRL